jgi:hypothetical protein
MACFLLSETCVDADYCSSLFLATVVASDGFSLRGWSLAMFEETATSFDDVFGR